MACDFFSYCYTKVKIFDMKVLFPLQVSPGCAKNNGKSIETSQLNNVSTYYDRDVCNQFNFFGLAWKTKITWELK